MILDTLEELASRATPGPWTAERKLPDTPEGMQWWILRAPDDRASAVLLEHETDVAYIAAANPQTIKALIAVVRAAPEALAALTAIDEALNGEHDICDMCVARGPLREALAALEAL